MLSGSNKKSVPLCLPSLKCKDYHILSKLALQLLLVKKSKTIFKPCFRAILPQSIILHSKGLSVLPDHEIFY